MNYLDRPLVVELAQLALDAYNAPSDDALRKNEFNPLWIKKDQWPRADDTKRTTVKKPTGVRGEFRDYVTDYDIYTGFYAAFYEHMITGVGVFVIRGTDKSTYLDVLQDIKFVFNNIMEQYEEAKSFWFTVKNYYLTAGLTKIYVCGHSLGGIIAKMIAPITELDTVAFNSPGVIQYLKTNDLPYHLNYDREARHLQRVVTYCANGDPIGNLRNDNDFEPYKFVDVLGGEQIPENEDRLKSSTFIKDAFYNKGPVFLKYHYMVDMYEALKKSEYQHDAF